MSVLLLVAAIFSSGPSPAEAPAKLAMHPLVLAPGRVVMDYLGYVPETNQVWAPGGNTGKVFVVDAATEAIKSVDGFASLEKEGRLLGPSSVTFGPGTAYVGNRADGTVCAVSLKTLVRGACVTLPVPPDGLAYVATTGEVWATTPRSSSLTILGTGEGRLRVAGKIALDGAPEG